MSGETCATAAAATRPYIIETLEKQFILKVSPADVTRVPPTSLKIT
jgi:hypothetical protein